MRTLAVAMLAVSLSGCGSSASQRTKVEAPNVDFKPIAVSYDEAHSPAWNFQQELQAYAFQCELKASGANDVRWARDYQYGNPYLKPLSDCLSYSAKAGSQSLARLHQSSPSLAITEKSHALYSAWTAYMGSMGPYSPTDPSIKARYREAQTALLLEDRYSATGQPSAPAASNSAKSKERQVYELQQRNLPYEQYQQEYRRIVGQ